MQTPAAAIAYFIWARNRTGFLCCAAGLAAMALVYPVLFGYSRSLGTLIASTIPLVGIFGYALNATIFAQEQGSLSSSYPRHMLVLPVHCRTLVFWPILFGSLLAVCLWLFTARVIYRSSGLAIPVAIPSLALAVVVSWFQAFAWMPLRHRVLRAVIGSFATLVLGAIPVWIIRSDPEASTPLTSVLLVYWAAALALAFAALAAERRGDQWYLWFQGTSAAGGARRLARLRSARPFASSAKAQFAYEWRCHGLVVVGFLCGTMVMIWAVLLSAGKPVQAPLFPLILGLLLAAPLSSVGSMGPALSRLRPFWIDHRESNTFLTVRPMESAGFVIAKMRMAALTVFLSWVFILTGTALCFTLSRSLPAAISTWHRFASHYPGGRAPAICVLVCLLLPVVTWRLAESGSPTELSGSTSRGSSR
jgi:hypothetical protein